MRPSLAAEALPSSTRACLTTSQLLSRCERSGASSSCSAVEVLWWSQAFKLEGLSQAARSKVRSPGIQTTPQSVRVRHMQVYEDMKSELAIMTKPKDPNVLVVYGVYALRPAFLGV